MVLSSQDFQPGAKFVSEREWALQVGLLALPSGHTIPAHAHLLRDGPKDQLIQELLFVVSGKMEVDFFDKAGQLFGTETLRQGEILFHIRGGHAFRFLEPTRLIEVKSGPYLGREKDKVLLEFHNTTSLIGSTTQTEGSCSEAKFINHTHPVGPGDTDR
ncbi:MAG TPA: hypothetical protein VGT03_11930 [Candidatus Acidoferrales bacterium]|nr:hypothetical protein [Candidatus Acidoferrales bacterium]